MKRERRVKKGDFLKHQIYISGAVLLILIITFLTVYVIYKNKLRKLSESFSTPELITSLVPNDITNSITDASTEISKNINEALNNSLQNTQVEEKVNVENTKQNIEETATPTVIPEPEPKKVLKFSYPVEGEIVKEFAMENLIFSETLQEWTVHPGIDIKCDRATVVKSSEEGTIFAIKNDPRYGTTIIVDHGDGYKTVYSNLLTTEFVKEGESVTRGQSLGTVGNSAVFEIADEAHLHFELLKDEQNQDPKLFLVNP